jgi:DNA-binding XRE family transcriptional regulator
VKRSKGVKKSRPKRAKKSQEKLLSAKEKRAKREKELKRIQMLIDRNRKVAKNRGASWKKALKKARIKADDTALKRVRIDKNLTQKDLATSIGISQTFYGFIERREADAREIIVKKISRKLGIAKNDFFMKSKNTEKWRAI